MATQSPRPLSARQLLARQNRVGLIAESLGFEGHFEYRHVYSQTGGAQYGRGSKEDDDLLTVYAEAFERDADPDDFSLEAMIAHERAHQILAWHSRIARMATGLSLGSEEILASLLGSILCHAEADRLTLYGKAVAELLACGQSSESAERQVQTLWTTLKALL